MTVNGEWKLIIGAALVTVNYGIYMTCTPDPEDGAILATIVGTVAAIVTGVATRYVVQRRILRG